MYHTRALPGLLLILVIVSWCDAQEGGTRNKFLNVALKSNWDSTPLHLEASEYFAIESEKLFWQFIETYHSMGISPIPSTEEQKYNATIKVAESLLGHDKVQLLKLSLALRTYSPKIEIYRQLPKMESSAAAVDGPWVQLGSRVISSPTGLAEKISKFEAGQAVNSLLFEFDHIHPSSSPHEHYAILYADFSDPSFLSYHSILKEASTNGKIGYVLRHFVKESSSKINLQGWGVEIAIKNVEYKAMDDSKVAKETDASETLYDVDEEEEIAGFRLGTLKKRKPELAQQLDDFSTFLMGKDVQFDQLNVWDYKDMGLQASQKVVAASDPLRGLRDISQNFPSLAGSLTRLKINTTLKQEIQHNHKKLSEGENFILLNGRAIDPANVDAFEFLEVLRDEISKVELLRSLKMSLSSIVPFISTPIPERINLRYRVDSDAVFYANNLEKDEQYNRWPRNVNEFLRRVYPGQMRFVGRNFFTIIVVADPTTTQGIARVSAFLNLINQHLPARVGLLPIVKKGNSASCNLVKMLRYINDNYGGRQVFGFLNQAQSYIASMSNPLSEEDVKVLYQSVGSTYGLSRVSYESVTTSQESEQLLESMQSYLSELGIIEEDNLLFINGLLADSNRELTEVIAEAMSEQTPHLQNLVQQGRIHDGTNIYQFLMHPTDDQVTVARYNRHVPISDANPLNVITLVGTGIGTQPAGNWDTLDVQQKMSRVLSRLSYLETNKDSVKKFSQILLVDLSKSDHVELALQAIQFLTNSTDSRIALLFNPVSDPSTVPQAEFPTRFALEQNIARAGSNIEVIKSLLEAQREAIKTERPLSLDFITKIVEEARKGKKLFGKTDNLRERLIEERSWSRNVVGVENGTATIVINGRIIELEESTFVSKDFELLEIFQNMRHGKPLDTLLLDPNFVGVDPDDLTSAFLSSVAMSAGSLLGLDEQNGIKRRAIASDVQTSVNIVPEGDTPLHIVAVLDPLSKASQKISPILLTLRKVFSANIRVILNPVMQLSDLPLKRYYSYLFSSDIEFDQNGQLISGESATLAQLPPKRILTLGMDTPEAWLVQPVVARYDLDNIKLEDLGEEKILTAIFELEHIVVEGNCYDFSTFQWGMPVPPRGLELVLQPSNSFHLPNDSDLPTVDTLVMSNFGYFQLQANPGIWKLKLAEGRGTKIFSLVQDSSTKNDFRWVVVSSFLGDSVVLKVTRKPGMANEPLLIVEKEPVNANAWDTFSGLWKGKQGGETSATLHIFSLASGHLYERLLRIMMLSVVKQTTTPVKFWFLKNYLSPKFKDIIPHMAQKYGFSYELVTYKWPSWLRKQTEKQRIIWAYKILFLDVLFPLNVKKIIFVDADQVVRTDLMELYNMDLQGAPLAYTPFCNNKPEMDGFRFWAQGYWKDHLRGRPYHISALYVVDLQQFRRTAAGDQLRSTYDMLSRDPNSLANLDQDLPNYLQHAVKIHSLPQEWLWCETWCSEESKATAKTIDLCNNPLTKASKLENAVRILGDEWISLDNEAKQLEQEILQYKSTLSDSTPSQSHPHSSHATHNNAPSEKLAEAYEKQKKIFQQ